MALTRYDMKRWYLMLRGKSLFHVNQEIGKCFTKTGLTGYYNDLTEKVTKEPDLLGTDKLPLHPTANKELVYFPVAIFQYGFGAYDLYLQNGDERCLDKFMQCAKWALDNQEPSGAWNNFFFSYPQAPYGAMAQGEGASIMLRVYKRTNDERYLHAAKHALDFMLLPLDKGGTCLYENGEPVLMEYTHLPAVMNGWIYAWLGLYDYVVATGDKGYYKDMMDQSLQALEKRMPLFTTGYWSKYDLSKRIASPFYHHMHIALMQAMYQLTGHNIFAEYAKCWQHYEQRRLCKTRAFCVKVWQKIREQNGKL